MSRASEPARADFATLDLTILMPVFNDWSAADLLLRQLDEVCARCGLRPRVLLVNDGSTERADVTFLSWNPIAFRRVEVLDLHCNLGHQRALCVGAFHVNQQDPRSALLMMDADGEDSPKDVPALVQTFLKTNGEKAVFAERGRRIESATFKLFYQFYRLVHFLLVGFDVRIGNFSILPPGIVASLLRSGDFWNHYAATVVKLRLPKTTIRVDRARRINGKSQMSFSRLVVHGLSAMAVYNETIGVRTLLASTIVVGAAGVVFGAVIVIRFATTLAIPGWATMAIGLLLLFVLQVSTIALLFSFGVLASRGIQAFIPIRDCALFISEVRVLGQWDERL